MPIYDFAVGQTNPETFPVEGLKQAAARAIEAEHPALNRYPGDKGHEGLRRLMAARESEREGIPVDPEQLALTNGSMQAVTMVGQALMASQGDAVITEEYTYSGTIGAYKGLGLKLVGIPMDDQGMRTDLLADKLSSMASQGTLPKFIYTLTTYQNPTGTCMPVERKRQLIELAARYDLPLVEDNCYGDVHFDGEVAPAMFAMDAGAKQVYIGSLSKIFAPGMRLGYFYAREPLFTQIVRHRFDAGSNYFAAAVLAEFYRDGIKPHGEATLPALKTKRDLLVTALAEHLDDTCVWSHPRGGLFLWLRLPEDTDMDKLVSISNSKNLYFAPGANFHIDRRPCPYIRLAFGHVPDQLIPEAIPLLAQSIKEARTSNQPRTFNSLF